MKLTITGRKMKVSDSLKSTVEQKLKKFDRYFGEDAEVNVVMAIEKDRHILEITVKAQSMIFRTQQITDDMYYSLNQSISALERQLRKNKTRLEKKLREGALADFNEFELAPNDQTVVKVKRFDLKPMDIEDAILQMEMLGHEFFVFKNTPDLDTCVVYKRKDGAYGLIEPDNA